jgi:hypothetical protein
MAEVFLCPTGALSRQSVRDLRKAGVVVVETDQPERCTFIRSTETISSTDMLWAAISALQVAPKYSDHGTAQREEFTRLLFTLIDVDHKRRHNEAPTDGKSTDAVL